MKKIVIGFIGVVAIGIIACATISSANNDDRVGVTAKSTTKWKEKAPDLFVNAGYSKLINSNDLIRSGVNESQAYIGKVTNPFGIRDDVLEFIINSFPNNESAVYAAIRNEQYSILIYRSKTDKEAVEYANQGAIVIWCLQKAVGDSVDKYIDIKNDMEMKTAIGKEIDKVTRQKLGWKIFRFGSRTNQELDTICDKGNY